VNDRIGPPCAGRPPGENEKQVNVVSLEKSRETPRIIATFPTPKIARRGCSA
jgi:hypothetical protein